MRRRRLSRRSRDQSGDLTTFDRVTNAVFMAVLILGAAAFASYGPEAACRHIADVIASKAAAMALTNDSSWAIDPD